MDTTEYTEDISVALERAIGKFVRMLASDDVELSLADFARLLQIRKEYGGAQRPAITVRWVDEWSSSLPSEE